MSEISLRARNFVLLHQAATLSTLSVSHKGYPFGSIVPYDCDDANHISIFVSRISEHFKNLQVDGRASLLVAENLSDDPQAEARATLLLRLAEVGDNERKQVEDKYFGRFAKATSRALAHDFVFFRGAIERVRWIGGFGEIRWIESEDLAQAPYDDIAYHGWEMIQHMNFDHQQALRDIVRAETGKDTSEMSLRMVSIDRSGFQIILSAHERKKNITISFPEPVKAASEVRAAMIALAEKSRKNR